MLGPLVRNCRRTLLTQLMDRLPVLEGVKAHNFQAFGCHILCPVWLLPTRLFWFLLNLYVFPLIFRILQPGPYFLSIITVFQNIVNPHMISTFSFREFYWQTHFGISSFSHTDNALELCGLLTPLHIVPEWYFLCQYAMLKAVPNNYSVSVWV